VPIIKSLQANTAFSIQNVSEEGDPLMPLFFNFALEYGIGTSKKKKRWIGV
jgi:hypothetical protein